MYYNGRQWQEVEESGGFHMFMGEYHHNIDEKGRIVLPSKFREALGNTFIIARGIEKCLYVYTMDDWNTLVNKMSTLPFTKKDARIFIRSFFSGATECEFDKSGRTCVSSPLVSYAGLKKECVIAGVNDRIEIWDKDSWDAFLKENEENLDTVAENLFMDVNI